jgi:chemotaxis protein MotA
MDLTTVLGIVGGISAIILGQVLEGGHVGALVQPTAALIVLGGTFGAVFTSTPGPILLGSIRAMKKAFVPVKSDPGAMVEQIIVLSAKARKEGLLALENDVASMTNPFMKKAFSLAVDGLALDGIMATMHADMDQFEEREVAYAKVFDAAGGFSPTLGIIGAVMGLIHVMENLSDASKLGGGIAVAFVATIYGLVFANLIALPIGSKLKARIKEEIETMAVILEGVSLIYSGGSQHLIEQRLGAYIKKPAEPPVETPSEEQAPV